MEVWKPIKDFNGYEVSNTGQVRSTNYRGKGVTRILKTSPDKMTGYMKVALIKDGKTKPKTVHRLVADAFIENPNNYPCVNHKDEDKTNNHVTNLEWCTHKYNANYGTRNERAGERKREKNK